MNEDIQQELQISSITEKITEYTDQCLKYVERK
jgi:hypothetical protein